jgi:hypothetical protein
MFRWRASAFENRAFVHRFGQVECDLFQGRHNSGVYLPEFRPKARFQNATEIDVLRTATAPFPRWLRQVLGCPSLPGICIESIATSCNVFDNRAQIIESQRVEGSSPPAPTN